MRWKVQSLVVAGGCMLVGYSGTAAAQEWVAATPPPGGAYYDADGALLERDPPRWLRRPVPTERDLPRRLLSTRGPFSAAAIIACRAEADGSLSDCRVESEAPERKGVGDAALGIVRRGRLVSPIAPEADGTQPIVRTTITFSGG